MSQTFIYFDITRAVSIHDWIIDTTGGLTGNNNLDLLDGTLEHIQNDLYYPEFEDKLTHLVYSVNKAHAFSDGNKRSCIALGALFLKLNGYTHLVNHFVKEMENITVCIANNDIDKGLLSEIISSLLFEEDYSESVKLKIAMAIMNIQEESSC